MRALIIADDLTGALDSAVAFSAAGLRSVVARRPADVPEAFAQRPEVLAISTASREGGAEAGRDAVEAAVEACGTLPEIVFKKVDSRLKGHVAAEAAALAVRAGRTRALVAPAVPAQGRTVEGGFLTGAGVSAPIDVRATMAGSGLGLAVPDTRDDADLDAAVAGALDGAPVLLVGAAGLAAAVGRWLAPGLTPPALPRLDAPLLLAIGSRDAITLAQVERIAGRADVALALAPDGACPPGGGGGVMVVRVVAGEGGGFDPGRAGKRFAAGIAQLVRGGGFRTLLGCGGETADAILGQLGVGCVDVVGELLPGVPVSVMVVDGRRMQLVTKSGGFGGPDALAAVIDAAATDRETTR